MIDDKEQNRFKENGLFSVENDTRIKIIKWESGKDYDFLEAEHNGYSRLKDPVIHRRSILFDKEKKVIIIRDKLLGKGTHRCISCFNTPPAIECEIEPGLGSVVILKTGIPFARILTEMADNGAGIDIGESFYSESYGRKADSRVLKFAYQGKLPAVFTYMISKAGSGLSKTDLDSYIDKFKGI